MDFTNNQVDIKNGDIIQANEWTLWRYQPEGSYYGKFIRDLGDFPVGNLIVIHRAPADNLPLGSIEDISREYNGSTGTYTFLLPYKVKGFFKTQGQVDPEGPLYWIHSSVDDRFFAGGEKIRPHPPLIKIGSNIAAFMAFNPVAYLSGLKQAADNNLLVRNAAYRIATSDVAREVLAGIPDDLKPEVAAALSHRIALPAARA